MKIYNDYLKNEKICFICTYIKCYMKNLINDGIGKEDIHDFIDNINLSTLGLNLGERTFIKDHLKIESEDMFTDLNEIDHIKSLNLKNN